MYASCKNENLKDNFKTKLSIINKKKPLSIGIRSSIFHGGSILKFKPRIREKRLSIHEYLSVGYEKEQ